MRCQGNEERLMSAFLVKARCGVFGLVAAFVTVPSIADTSVDDRLELREIFPVLSVRGAVAMETHRSVCAAGREQRRGVGDISVYAFCREVLEQTIVRELDAEWETAVLEDWTVQHAPDALARAMQASIRDERTFLLMRDDDDSWARAPLNCTLAYDVGLTYGYSRASEYAGYAIPLNSELQDSACHENPETISTRFGFLLGLRDGISLSKRLSD
jgi:hypothetical protein